MYSGPVGSVDITSTSSTGYLLTTTITDASSSIVNIPKGTTIFHISLISGATPSNIQISNGLSGNIRINRTGTASIGVDYDFSTMGIPFPLGAYVIFDGNQTGGVITCVADQL